MSKMLDFNDGTAAWRSSRAGRVALAAWMAWLLTPAVMGQQPAVVKEPPTFTKDVAPILQEKCQNCHRRHQVGPFALETYEQARKRAADIAAVAGDRLMPPWKPAPGSARSSSTTSRSRPQEIAILVAWAEAGAPQGDPKAHAAAAPVRRGLEARAARPGPRAGRGLPDPRLGTGRLPLLRAPHQPRAGHVHRGGRLPPGNRRVVHHIIAFIDTTGDARKRDEAEPGPGYTSFAGPGIEASRS